MDSVGEAVEQGAGETLGAEDLGPVLKGEIGGNHQTLAFVSAADYLEEEFCPCLGKRHVPQFVQHEELLAFQLLLESLERPVFSALQELSDQPVTVEKRTRCPCMQAENARAHARCVLPVPLLPISAIF
jgi:hypothetical protein